jgi:hypothetical protein
MSVRPLLRLAHPVAPARRGTGLAARAAARACRTIFFVSANRYVLTDTQADTGGVQFGQRLDEASETAQREDVITLLDTALANDLLQGFLGSPPKYSRDPTEVVGKGTKIV